MLYGYIYEGTYKYDDFDNVDGKWVLKADIPDNGTGRSGVQPGDARFRDINGDGTVNADDCTIIGRGQPLHTGGFNNTFEFFGFDLNVFFQWNYGNDILNAARTQFVRGKSEVGYNRWKEYCGRWTPENPMSDIPRVGGWGSSQYSTFEVEDGSFLRLKKSLAGLHLALQDHQEILRPEAAGLLLGAESGDMEQLFGLRPRSFDQKYGAHSRIRLVGLPALTRLQLRNQRRILKTTIMKKLLFIFIAGITLGSCNFFDVETAGFVSPETLLQGRGERSESTGRRLRTAVRPVVLRPGLVLRLQPAGRLELLRPQLYQTGTVSEQLHLYERDAEQPLGESLHGYRPRQLVPRIYTGLADRRNAHRPVHG